MLLQKKPTNRKLTSQHPYAENFIGEFIFYFLLNLIIWALASQVLALLWEVGPLVRTNCLISEKNENTESFHQLNSTKKKRNKFQLETFLFGLHLNLAQKATIFDNDSFFHPKLTEKCSNFLMKLTLSLAQTSSYATVSK